MVEGSNKIEVVVKTGSDIKTYSTKVLCVDKINDLAEKGNCVIVGRCADYILRKREDCLNVFVLANEDYKAKRIVELYGVRDESPEKRLEEKDARRKVNYKYFTGREWGVASNYHLCLDSGVLGAQKCVDIICEAAE